jgi:hypothetical protein
VADLAEGNGEREPHVPESHDADLHCSTPLMVSTVRPPSG